MYYMNDSQRVLSDRKYIKNWLQFSDAFIREYKKGALPWNRLIVILWNLFILNENNPVTNKPKLQSSLIILYPGSCLFVAVYQISK